MAESTKLRDETENSPAVAQQTLRGEWCAQLNMGSEFPILTAGLIANTDRRHEISAHI